MSFPTQRQTTTSVIEDLNDTTNTYTFSSNCLSGNLIVCCLAGDKNTGNISVSDNIGTNGGANPWNIGSTDAVQITGASVSLYIAWKVAVGGENQVVITTASPPSTGNSGWAEEMQDDGAGTWRLLAKAQPTYSDSARSSAPSGTTSPAVEYDGRALAVGVVDSVSSLTNESPESGNFSAPFTRIHTAPATVLNSGGGHAGCWVGTANVSLGNTTSTTFSFSGSDQTTCAIAIFGREEILDAPPTVNVGADVPSHLYNTEIQRTATIEPNGGTVSSTVWTLESAPSGVTLGQVDTDTTLNYTPTVLGAYTFRLTATNEFGTNFDEFIVTVDAGQPGTIQGVPILGVDKLAVRLSGATGVIRMAVSSSSGMTSPTYGPQGTQDGLGNVHLAFPAGLVEGNTYYYQVDSAQTLIGTVRSFVYMPGGTTFKIGFGSCRGHNVNEPSPDPTAFSRMKTRGANMFWMTGDLHYRDISTNSPSSFRSGYDEVATRTNFSTLLATVHSDYVWSDHDFGGDNSDSTSSAKPAAQSVYRERFPSVALPSATGGIYHTYKIWDDRVRVITLDTRSYRSPSSNADNSSKTMLGTEQKAWLQNLLANPDTILTFIISAEGWIGTDTADDHWGRYQTERSEIAGWIQSSATECIFICGDAHMLAYDDGTNSAGGVPVWHAAALNRFGSTKGGPYSGGTNAGGNQYGLITLTQNANDITALYQGYTSSDTVWGSHTVTIVTSNSESVSDNFTLTEQSLVTVVYPREENYTVTEQTAPLGVSPGQAESFTVTETASVEVNHNRTDADYNLTEALQHLQLLAVEATPELFTFTEQPWALHETRFPSETFELQEDLFWNEFKEFPISDQFELTESAHVESIIEPRVDEFSLAETQDFIIVAFGSDVFEITSEQVISISGEAVGTETFILTQEFGNNAQTDLPNYLFGIVYTEPGLGGAVDTDNKMQADLVLENQMRVEISTVQIAGEVSQPGRT